MEEKQIEIIDKMLLKRKLFAQGDSEKDNSLRNAAVAGGVGLGATALGGHILGNVNAYNAGKDLVNKEQRALDKTNREIKSDFSKAKREFVRDVKDNKRYFEGVQKRISESRARLRANSPYMSDSAFDLEQSRIHNASVKNGRDYVNRKAELRDSWRTTKESLKGRADSAAAKFNKNTSKEALTKVGKKAYKGGFAKAAGAGLLATAGATALAYNQSKKKEGK